MNEPIPVDERLLPPEPYYRPAPRGLLNLNLRMLLLFAAAWALVSYFESMGFFPAGFGNWCIGGLVGFLILMFVSRTRKTKRWTQSAQKAVGLLHAGDVAGAAGIFDELCRDSCGSPARHIHAGFVFNRAVAYLYSGDVRKALSLSMAVLQSRWFEEERYGMYLYLPELLELTARCYAVQGELEKAEEYQRIAHDVIPPEREARLMLLDLLIAVRRGRYDVGVKDVDAKWAGGSELLNPADARSARLLRAFALKLRTPELGEAELKDALEGTRFFTEGQFDYLAGNWPEFREFLLQHRFLAKPAG